MVGVRVISARDHRWSFGQRGRLRKMNIRETEYEGAFRLSMSLDGKTLDLGIEVGGVAAGGWLRG